MAAPLLLAVLTAWLAVGTVVTRAQGDRGVVTGLLSDPGGDGLAGVEVVLTGVDVRATYTARTDGEGRYDFPGVAPGAYRVIVRRPDIVPVDDTLKVAAGERLRSDIRTTLRLQIGMALRAASAEALRQWVSLGTPPAGPLEWECTSNGVRCSPPPRAPSTERHDADPVAAVVMPSLVPQPLSEMMINALIALHGRTGVVQMSGVIASDGFMGRLSVNSATSPELAAAVVVEVGRMRWEPARMRGLPVDTSVTMEIRF
jgi:hypothetical protein